MQDPHPTTVQAACSAWNKSCQLNGKETYITGRCQLFMSHRYEDLFSAHLRVEVIEQRPIGFADLAMDNSLRNGVPKSVRNHHYI